MDDSKESSTFFSFHGFFLRITARKSESPAFSIGGVARHLGGNPATLGSNLNIDS
jgi:hypothetical protein